MSVIHTIVIGSSKSKNENAYYIESKDKFWGLIKSAGLTKDLLSPFEYRVLTNEYGIGFGELAFDYVFLGEQIENEAVANDKLLNDQIEILNIGIPKLVKHIKELKPKRIVFNGKGTAACFYEYLKKGKVEKIKASYVKELNFSYGKVDTWNGIEIWMLPNLSNAAGKYWKEDNGEQLWLNFWKTVADDKPKNTTKAWLWVLIIATIIISFLLFNLKNN